MSIIGITCLSLLIIILVIYIAIKLGFVSFRTVEEEQTIDEEEDISTYRDCCMLFITELWQKYTDSQDEEDYTNLVAHCELIKKVGHYDKFSITDNSISFYNNKGDKIEIEKRGD